MDWHIDSDAIVFNAVLDDGVCIVTEEMVDLAGRIAKDSGREIMRTVGNFERVRFLVDKEFEVEEADIIEMNKKYIGG